MRLVSGWILPPLPTAIKRNYHHLPQCKKRSAGQTASHIRRRLLCEWSHTPLQKYGFRHKATLTDVGKSGGHAVGVVRVVVVDVAVVVDNYEIIAITRPRRTQPHDGYTVCNPHYKPTFPSLDNTFLMKFASLSRSSPQ